jgi:hypothetical protein
MGLVRGQLALILVCGAMLAVSAPLASAAAAPDGSAVAAKKKCKAKKGSKRKRCRPQPGPVQPVGPPAPAVQHLLSVTRAGSGDGSVGSNPAGISCGTDCSEAYDQGTTVALTRLPDANSVFTGWSGACTGTGFCVVTMDAARSVTANFAALHALTVSVSGSGSGTVGLSPDGIACGGACSKYPQGTQVTATANWSPATTVFVGWKLDDTFVGNANPLVFTMNGPHTLQAQFALKPDFGG